MSEAPEIEGSSPPPASALARNRVATGAISTVARKLRFVNSRRNRLYRSVGLRPRPVDRLFKALSVALVILCLVAPNTAAIAYFCFIASDQYQSETRFTVQSSAPFARDDRLGRISGLPSAQIVQDTQIVTSYIESRAMLSVLEKEADFDHVYEDKAADWVARLADDSTDEDKLDYWKRMVDTGIDAKSGIVIVKVHAFTAEAAHRILTTVVHASEKLINDLNDRVWADVTRSAERQVAKATQALATARQQLQDARNAAGILTVTDTSNSLSALLTQLRGEKIELQNTYDVNAQTISEDAPQMLVLARQIASKEKQIEELGNRIAGEAPAGKTLADASSKFSQLNLNQSVAEQQLKASIGALEQLQFSSQQQMMYLDAFLAPTLPDSAEYPRRVLWPCVIFATSLVGFGFAWLGLSAVRRRFD
ncbi:MAG TPA: capsule biosynthesis protein [Pararhizobium sp.]|nr:capsule biosynthesis protein [Pararhizobium sp.]